MIVYLQFFFTKNLCNKFGLLLAAMCLRIIAGNPLSAFFNCKTIGLFPRCFVIAERYTKETETLTRVGIKPKPTVVQTGALYSR